MNRHDRLCFALFVCCAAGAFASLAARAAEPADDDEPAVNESSASFLRPGELVVFRLGWGIFGNAGETRIETIPEPAAEGDRLRVRVTTKSKGIVDAIYPISNDSVSLIDATTGRPLWIEVSGKEGKRDVHTTTRFDYEAGTITHTDHLRPHRSGVAKIPAQPAYDLMVTMMQLREAGLQPGDARDVLCVADDDLYSLTLTALRAARIKTPAGTFDAVQIEPAQRGEQKGFFKKGGSMHFWISRDAQPQIVRMDFKAKAGTITASLVRVGRVDADADADSGS